MRKKSQINIGKSCIIKALICDLSFVLSSEHVLSLVSSSTQVVARISATTGQLAIHMLSNRDGLSWTKGASFKRMPADREETAKKHIANKRWDHVRSVSDVSLAAKVKLLK